MKLYVLVVTIVAVMFLFSCSSSVEKGNGDIETLDYKTFKIVEKNFENLAALGNITKVIKLETSKDSLISSVDHVEVDRETGDLLVGDFRKGKCLLRFNSQGKFIRRYGKIGEGPGEYHYLFDFALASNGDVILLCHMKLIKYSREGDFLKEIRLDYSCEFAECINNLLYLSVLRYRKAPEKKNAVLIFNPFFEKVGGLGDYDDRLKKFLFISEIMTKKGDYLYFADYYDLNLNIYDTKTKKMARLSIPNDNDNLDKIWNKRRLTMEDENKIHRNLHHFNGIFGIDERILLFESLVEKSVFNAWLLNLKKKEIVKFKRQNLRGEFGVKVQKALYFDRIPGSYDGGIIGAFVDEEDFNLHKKDYPLLKDVQFNMDDNPILAYFEFHKDLK